MNAIRNFFEGKIIYEQIIANLLEINFEDIQKDKDFVKNL